MWDGETVLFRLFAQHPGTEISSQQVSETIRKARQAQVQRILLCTTAPLSSAACRLAETAEPSLRLVGREELIQLAGACCPATDEDLCRLKQCKPKRRFRPGMAENHSSSQPGETVFLVWRRSGGADTGDRPALLPHSRSGLPAAVRRLQDLCGSSSNRKLVVKQLVFHQKRSFRSRR